MLTGDTASASLDDASDEGEEAQKRAEYQDEPHEVVTLGGKPTLLPERLKEGHHGQPAKAAQDSLAQITREGRLNIALRRWLIGSGWFRI